MVSAREILAKPLQSRAWKATSEWLRGGPRPRRRAASHELDNVAVPADVIVYFGDSNAKIYQLQQWLPVLEGLAEKYRVLLVFRRLSALRAAKEETDLPKIFVRSFDDLINLYEANDYGLCLYVNNGVSNFQSLSDPDIVHVHVNHGESDKISMVSNQAKAYDRVFVAGPAAIARHQRVLFDFDMDHLVEVGRPQLDIEFAPLFPHDDAYFTVMYAPTWEGENDNNNYTSVDLYGVRIVAALLANPKVRVVYKPHPRILDTTDPALEAAHSNIVAMLRSDTEETGRPHLVSLEGNILAMFEPVDAMVTDISSVGLDFLYGQVQKPLVITDRRTDRDALSLEAPVSAGVEVIDGDNVDEIDAVFDRALFHDGFHDRRQEIRKFYFGSIQPGDSTRLFASALEELMSDRAVARAARTTEYL